MYHLMRAYIKPNNRGEVYKNIGTVRKVIFMDYSDHHLIKLDGVDRFFKPYEIELMIDTGIEDVHSKLVYDGDVVRDLYNDDIFEVAYHDGKFVRISKEKEIEVGGRTVFGGRVENLLDEYGEFPFEVIGNKYENKYLMESKDD